MQIETLMEQPSFDWQLIEELTSIIRDSIKVFDQKRFYNLLTRDALHNLLQSIRELVGYTESDSDADTYTYAEYFSAHRSRSDSVSF